jgi:hypothetical protein
MPGAILPVKRPETDPGLIPRRERDLARYAYRTINAKSLPPDVKLETKNPLAIGAKELFAECNPRSGR